MPSWSFITEKAVPEQHHVIDIEKEAAERKLYGLVVSS
jgi:hypothetical protein